MPLPDLVKHSAKKKIEAFCERRVPAHVRDQIRLTIKFRGSSMTLIENRPYFRDPSTWTEAPIAQFRFDTDKRSWKLYSRDRNSRWHEYDFTEPRSSLDELIEEVDRDPTGIFWG